MNSVLIIIILVSVFSFSFVEKVSGNYRRIIGGDLAPSEFGKFHASIQNLTRYHVCGGGVVSRWLIVTAAHCVDGVNPDYMKIVVGTNDLRAGGRQYDVAEIIVHYNFNATSRINDIALLKTTAPFDLNYARVLNLRERELVEGDDVSITGFGAQEPNGLSSYKMQVLNISVFSQETCEFAMRYSRPVTEQMFCTFSRVGVGTCHGDSGSPIINGNEIVGVVAWGIPCAVGFPDVHTRISPYVKWIQMHIHKINCKPRVSTTTSIYEKLQYLARHMTHVSTEHTKLLKISN